MDELRTEIWDYLYRSGEAKTVEVIAEGLQQSPEAVREAVDHGWFEVSGDVIRIAGGDDQSQ